jgi:hypothetical protein
MHSPISSEDVQTLTSQFASILTQGGDMVLSGPLEEELEEKELVHLPRLVIDFNRHDFGRLRTLIDAINEL